MDFDPIAYLQDDEPKQDDFDPIAYLDEPVMPKLKERPAMIHEQARGNPGIVGEAADIVKGLPPTVDDMKKYAQSTWYGTTGAVGNRWAAHSEAWIERRKRSVSQLKERLAKHETSPYANQAYLQTLREELKRKEFELQVTGEEPLGAIGEVGREVKKHSTQRQEELGIPEWQRELAELGMLHPRQMGAVISQSLGYMAPIAAGATLGGPVAGYAVGRELMSSMALEEYQEMGVSDPLKRAEIIGSLTALTESVIPSRIMKGFKGDGVAMGRVLESMGIEGFTELLQESIQITGGADEHSLLPSFEAGASALYENRERLLEATVGGVVAGGFFHVTASALRIATQGKSVREQKRAQADFTKVVSEKMGLHELQVWEAMEVAREAQEKGRDYTSTLNRELEWAYLQTPQGMTEWAASNILRSTAFSHIEAPSRKQWSDAGLPERSAGERAAFTALLRHRGFTSGTQPHAMPDLQSRPEQQAEVAAQPQAQPEVAAQPLPEVVPEVAPQTEAAPASSEPDLLAEQARLTALVEKLEADGRGNSRRAERFRADLAKVNEALVEVPQQAVQEQPAPQADPIAEPEPPKQAAEPEPEPQQPAPSLLPQQEGGPEFQAVTPQEHVRVKGRWRLVDASQVRASKDPDYPDELQPRDRYTFASNEQIEDIAERPDPTRLGGSPTTDNGAPIVDSFGNVVSGNGRVMGLREAYARNNATGYRQGILAAARELGIDISGADAMKRPILIREITDTGGRTLPELAELSNRDQLLRRSIAEVAEADAKAIIAANLLPLFRPNDEGSVLAASNREFMNAFTKATGDQSLRKKDGSYTKDANVRIRRAVLAALFTGHREGRAIASALIESSENYGLVRQVDGVTLMAGRLMQLAQKKPPYDITADLASALADVMRYKQQLLAGEVNQLQDYLNQGMLFDAISRTPESTALLMMLAEAKSMAAVRDFLGDYATAAERIDTTTDDMFGQTNLTAKQLLETVRDAGQQERQPELEADQPELQGDDAGGGRRDAQQSADAEAEGAGGSDAEAGAAAEGEVDAKQYDPVAVDEDFEGSVDDAMSEIEGDGAVLHLDDAEAALAAADSVDAIQALLDRVPAGEPWAGKFRRRAVNEMGRLREIEELPFSLLGTKSLKHLPQAEQEQRKGHMQAAVRMASESGLEIGKPLSEGDKVANERIRLATGWFKGLDGKWRYEVDDSTASLKAPPRWNVISGENAVNHGVRMIGHSAMLSDVLEHPALLKAWPRLGEIEVTFVQNLGQTAAYSHDTQEITVGIGGQTVAQALRQNETLRRVMHEVQHAIQALEGFARGGDPRAEASRLQGSLADGTAAYRRLGGEIEARDTARRLGLNAAERSEKAPYGDLESEGIKVDEAILRNVDPDVAMQISEPAPVRDLGAMPEGVKMVDREADLPKRLRPERLAGRIEGVYDRNSGMVYLVNENIASAERAAEVAAHELIGHKGLESVLGDKLGGVLDEVATSVGNRKLIGIAREYGYDLKTEQGRRKSAGEYVARIAERQDKPAWYARVLAAIRRWARQTFPGLKLNWTDADITAMLASVAAKRSQEAYMDGVAPAFSGTMTDEWWADLTYESDAKWIVEDVIMELGDSDLFHAHERAMDAVAAPQKLLKGEALMYSMSDELDAFSNFQEEVNSLLGYVRSTDELPQLMQSIRQTLADHVNRRYDSTEAGQLKGVDVKGMLTPNEWAGIEAILERAIEKIVDAKLDHMNKHGAELSLKRKHVTPEAVKAPDAEFEQRIQEAHGIKRAPFLAKKIEGVVNLWHKATRAQAAIPNTKPFAMANEGFRLLRSLPDTVQDKALRSIAGLTDKMDADQYALWERIVLMENMVASVERGEPLRFGAKSLEDAIAYRDQLRAQVDQTPAVKRALQRRKKLMAGLRNDLVNHGIIGKEQSENWDTYYRQMVLAYTAVNHTPTGRTFTKRKPGFAKRRSTGDAEMGVDGDYNTAYLEAEAEYFTQALHEIGKEKLLREHIDKPYNIIQKLKNQAKETNLKLAYGGADVLARVRKLKDQVAVLQNDPDKGESYIRQQLASLHEELNAIDVLKPFSVRIVRAKAVLAKMLRDGEIKVPRKHEAAAHNIAEGNNPDADIAEEADGAFFAFISWLAEQPGPEANPARGIFKAIADRNAFIKEQAGDKFATWEDSVPDTHRIWQPMPGNIWYQAHGVAEQLAEMLQQGIIESAELTAHDLRAVLAMGGKREQMVLPNEIVKQLNSMNKVHSSDAARLFQGAIKDWKVWTLLNPKRVFGYFARNMTGDVDPVIAANPAIIKHAPQAAKELWDYYSGKRTNMSADLKLSRDLGVIGSSLTAQEIPDLKELAFFNRFFEAEGGITSKVAAIPKMYFEKAKQYNEFREGILRHAAFLDYLQKVRSGQKFHYGGARKDVVDGLTTPELKSAHLARNLLGDYGNLTEMGVFLRNNLYPFWSWNEVNVKRYPRLVLNAFEAGGAKGAGLQGAAITAGALLRIGALYATTWLWNHLFFPDEEEMLANYDRANPHLILGRDDDGSTFILRGVSALGDFLEWFGLNDLAVLAPQLYDGQITGMDVAGEMAKAPLNKVLGGLRPEIGALWGGVTGTSLFPDATNPRTIDKRDVIPGIFGLQDEANAIGKHLFQSGAAARPNYGMRLLVGSTDFRQAALSDTYDMRDKFQTKKGKTVSTDWKLTEWTKVRRAASYDDKKAFDQALKIYLDSGKTKDDLVDSILRMDPLLGVPAADRAEFVNEFLSGVQRNKLGIARDYSHGLMDRILTWADIDRRELAGRLMMQATEAGASDEYREIAMALVGKASKADLEGALREAWADRGWNTDMRSRTNGRLTPYGHRVHRLRWLHDNLHDNSKKDEK